MKSALIIFFILLFSLQIFGQDFAPVGANWYYGESFAFSGNIDYLKITSEKDTLIHDVICQKIVKRHLLGCTNRRMNEYVFSRNDSVFFFDEPFNEFQLLYNFNAEINDIWIIKVKNEYQEIDTITILVDSTSTVRINDIDLKKLYVTYSKKNEHMTQSNQSTIIEKIGDVQYMFNWYPWSSIACDDNQSYGLRCYQDNALGLYSTGIDNACDYVHVWTNISNHNAAANLNVYPNPTNGIIDINLDNNTKSIAIITDVLGKPILQKDFTNSTRLDFDSFQKGLYILVIKQNNNTVFIRKILKY